MKLQIISPHLTDQERRIHYKYGLVILLCAFILVAGCDHTFEPLQENEKYYFSIYGFLDAAADTQWVRVGPTRQNINEIPDPSEIIVTLEHIQTGKTVIMNDSLFSSKGFLNYWSTLDIENEETYRITAQRDGKSSHVTVSTPKEIPAPYVVSDVTAFGSGYNVYIDDSVEHIADVQSVWYVILKPGIENRRRIYRFPLRNTLKFTSAFFGAYIASANHEEELKQIEQSIGSAEYSIERRQVFIAAGGPEWDNNLASIGDIEYFLDGTVSNVENGLGYVVGISSVWYRQATCLTPDKSNFAPCEPEEPFW